MTTPAPAPAPAPAPGPDKFSKGELRDVAGVLKVKGIEYGGEERPLKEAVEGEHQLRLTLGAVGTIPSPGVSWARIKEFLNKEVGDLAVGVDITCVGKPTPPPAPAPAVPPTSSTP